MIDRLLAHVDDVARHELRGGGLYEAQFADCSLGPNDWHYRFVSSTGEYCKVFDPPDIPTYLARRRQREDELLETIDVAR